MGTSNKMRFFYNIKFEINMRSTDYILIQGWMINDLGLKGNALLIFAIIYGFSKDGESEFTGSLKYLSKSTGSTKNTVIKAIQDLLLAQYIVKRAETKNSITFNSYSQNEPVVQKLVGGSAETAPGGSAETGRGSAETGTNNTIYTTSIDNTNDRGAGPEILKDIVSRYHQIKDLPKVVKLTDTRKKHILARVKEHGMEKVEAVFNKVINSRFCKGENRRGWKADIDFIFSQSGFIKILEGKYDDRNGTKNATDFASGRVASSGAGTGAKHITEDYLEQIAREAGGGSPR